MTVTEAYQEYLKNYQLIDAQGFRRLHKVHSLPAFIHEPQDVLQFILSRCSDGALKDKKEREAFTKVGAEILNSFFCLKSDLPQVEQYLSDLRDTQGNTACTLYSHKKKTQPSFLTQDFGHIGIGWFILLGLFLGAVSLAAFFLGVLFL